MSAQRDAGARTVYGYEAMGCALAYEQASRIARCYLLAPEGSEEESLLERAFRLACGSAMTDPDGLLEHVSEEVAREG